MLRQWNALCQMIQAAVTIQNVTSGALLLFFALADLYLFAALLLCLLVRVQMFTLTDECMLENCVHECWMSMSVLRLGL